MEKFLSNNSVWHTMDDAPKDGTLILLAYEVDGVIDYEVGCWVHNYGCPGWRGAGTFIDPILWTYIPPHQNKKHPTFEQFREWYFDKTMSHEVSDFYHFFTNEWK